MLKSPGISFSNIQRQVGVFGGELVRKITIFGLLLISVLIFSSCRGPMTTSHPSPKTQELLLAVREGKPDTVKALLAARDTDVNATDENGDTPLIEASRLGHGDIARALLADGADYKMRDRNGKTPLMLAVLGGHDDVVHVLKDAGAQE
jgi:ankyrin repeat protein